MRIARTQAVVALVVCCCAPALRGAGPATMPATVPTEYGRSFLHEPSHFKFPPAVGSFDRGPVQRFDDPGRDISVTYVDRRLKIAALTYVYPAEGGRVGEQFLSVQRDIARLRPEARLVAEGPWTLRQGKRQFQGLRATYAFAERFAGDVQDVLSEVYLLALNDQFIRFRITYPAANRDDAQKQIALFLDHLSMPKT
jgi:hypothetical protein